MTLSSILVLFLTHLGIGLAFTLLFVSREAGVKFFRFNTGLAAVFIGTGLAFRQSPASNTLTTVTTLALVLAGLTLIVYLGHRRPHVGEDSSVPAASGGSVRDLGHRWAGA